ncbi:MAG: MBOAT family protein, partial [Lachnospiraceae bacterium]|nr:MBOAT family protein [Lachnospiraceae bacterium]
IPAEAKGWRVFMVLRTFTMLCFLKLFDCYQSAGEVFRAYGSAFTMKHFGEIVSGGWLELGLSLADYVVVAVGSVVILTVSLIQRPESVRDQLSRKPFALQAGVVMALFLVTLIFGAYGMGYDASQFIYNRF